MPQQLPEVTLVLADCHNYGKAIASLKMSLKEIIPARTIFFTDIIIPDIDRRIEIVKIPKITSKEEYSRFIIKELYKYIKTNYVLVTQHDGYILDCDQWSDDFLKYDYIGAPWLYSDGRNVGNGGFSLRSLSLQRVLGNDSKIEICHPEDEVIGRLYRGYLQDEYGIKYADEELAESFSYELRAPHKPTFGFHGFFHENYKPTVVIKRKDAMGDVVQVEPILHHFHKKGYRVVLDTLPQFFAMYVQHYFKVYHPDEIDGRLLKTATIYNLDMSYETNPRQLHLKSYFDYCEVPEGERNYRNPLFCLNIPAIPETRFFKKYCVVHIDKREGGRDIQGTINWAAVAIELGLKGYYVIQIGKGKHEDIPTALQMNAPTELFLMWLLRDADLFIGVDSGPSNIAVAFNTPSVILFGSVEPKYIYANFDNIEVVQHENVCRSPKCWSSVESTQGIDCIEDKKHPPCVQFTTDQILSAINNLELKINND